MEKFQIDTTFAGSPEGLEPSTFQISFSNLIEILWKTFVKIDFLRFRRVDIKAKHPKGYISFGVFDVNLFKILAQGYYNQISLFRASGAWVCGLACWLVACCVAEFASLVWLEQEHFRCIGYRAEKDAFLLLEFSFQ